MTTPGTGQGKRSPRLKRAKRFRRGTWAQRFVRTEGVERVIAAVVRVFIRIVRWIGRRRAEKTMLLLARAIGPLTQENRTAVVNIAKAYPEKSEAERAAILRGCWDNIARVAVEFLFLKEMTESFDPARPDEGPITVSGIEQFVKLRDDGKTAVIFTAHLANWEVLGVIAAKFGLEAVLPYRAPSNAHLAEDLLVARDALMGMLVPNAHGAAFEITVAMEAGAHLGMLVDQKLFAGVPVPFFGQLAPTNTLAARFARRFDCAVHGARAIRLPGGRLHLELTPPVEMPRDADGLIDVTAATAKITSVVEGWVREHPEQWLWVHDRWMRPKH